MDSVCLQYLNSSTSVEELSRGCRFLLLMFFVFQALLAQILFECLEQNQTKLEALTLKERLKHPSI